MRLMPLVVALSSSLLGTSFAAAQATDSTRPPPADQAGPSLRLQSFSLIVPDYDEAKAWYTTRLGLVVVRDQAFGRNERFVMVAAPGNRDVGIVLQKARTDRRPDEPNMPTDYSDRVGKTVNVVLHSGDVTAYAAGLAARGVKLDGPPRQLPWGGQVTFRDLYGNSFVVVGPLTARDSGGPVSRATRAPRARMKTNRRRWGGGDVFVALADPTRRRIMDLLSDGDKPVHALSDTFDVSRPAISQHLRVLREANLVQEHRVGRERHYRLHAAALREVAMWVARYDRFWDERLTMLGTQLDAMEPRR